MKYLSFFALCVLITFSSCSYNSDYQRNDDVENESWNIPNVFVHKIDIKDTLDVFNMFVNIRNTVDYKYSNLFMFVTTKFPNGKMAKDTLECVLADVKGKWYGVGKGRTRDSKILFKPNVRFPMHGTYQIEIQQAMREDPLIGIANVGLSLEKVN